MAFPLPLRREESTSNPSWVFRLEEYRPPDATSGCARLPVQLLKHPPEHPAQFIRADRVQQVANLIVARRLLQPKQALRIIAPFGFFHRPLMRQKGGGLHEKYRKRRPPRLSYRILHILPLPLVWKPRNRSRNSEIVRLSANRSFIFTLPLYFSTLSYRLYTPTFFTLRIAVKYLLKFIFKSDIV